MVLEDSWSLLPCEIKDSSCLGLDIESLEICSIFTPFVEEGLLVFVENHVTLLVVNFRSAFFISKVEWSVSNNVGQLHVSNLVAIILVSTKVNHKVFIFEHLLLKGIAINICDWNSSQEL